MRSNFLEALMGGVVIIVAGIFLGIVYTNSDAPSIDGYTLKAYFSRVDGLALGGDVKMSGVKIGTISSIQVDPQSYQALVVFRVKSELNIPEDSSAEVISEGFLGGKYLVIVPGGSNTFLEDGDSLEHTESSISLEGLITKFLTNQGTSPAPAVQPEKAQQSENKPVVQQAFEPVPQEMMAPVPSSQINPSEPYSPPVSASPPNIIPMNNGIQQPLQPVPQAPTA